MPERWYELKLADGTTAEWTGNTDQEAARRYVDMHRDAEVIATRLARREQFGIFTLGNSNQIIP